MDRNLRKLLETVKNREAWRAAAHGVAKSRTRLSNWTTITPLSLMLQCCGSQTLVCIRTIRSTWWKADSWVCCYGTKVHVSEANPGTWILINTQFPLLQGQDHTDPHCRCLPFLSKSVFCPLPVYQENQKNSPQKRLIYPGKNKLFPVRIIWWTSWGRTRSSGKKDKD